MLRVKKGVVFKCFKPKIIDLLEMLNRISEEIEKDIWITSANDGKHSENSYHYKNLALDLRIWNLEKKDINYVIENLTNDRFQFLFSPDHKYYDIVLEKDHIHCEYDERKANQ